MSQKVDNLGMVHKKVTISIQKEQYDWIRDNDINLSRLVQKAILERMKKR